MLEDTLQRAQQWMNLNHLKLNTDKTEFIYFGHYKHLKKCTGQEINVCEDIVNRKESICYLGLTMDKNRLFKNHIFNINKKTSYNLFMMGKIHRYLSINTVQELGLAFVVSNMDYCNGVLSGSLNSVLQPLQITQNICAKMILYKNKYSSSTDARYTLHWLPIKDRILYKNYV